MSLSGFKNKKTIKNNTNKKDDFKKEILEIKNVLSKSNSLINNYNDVIKQSVISSAKMFTNKIENLSSDFIQEGISNVLLLWMANDLKVNLTFDDSNWNSVPIVIYPTHISMSPDGERQGSCSISFVMFDSDKEKMVGFSNLNLEDFVLYMTNWSLWEQFWFDAPHESATDDYAYANATINSFILMLEKMYEFVNNKFQPLYIERPNVPNRIIAKKQSNQELIDIDEYDLNSEWSSFICNDAINYEKSMLKAKISLYPEYSNTLVL